MKFFILEDEIDKLPRCAILESLKDHTLTVAQSLTEAKEKYKGPYDILLLDCDMRGIWGDHDHPNSGWQFVKWLVRLEHANKPKVYLHSQNHIGRALQAQLLSQHGFHFILEMPFSSAYVDLIQSL